MTETAVAVHNSKIALQNSKKTLWIGRTLSTLAVLVFVLTLTFGFLKPDVAAQGFAHYNFREGAGIRIMIVEIACVVLYVIPSTSILGAILLAAYLGGATATHFRVGEPFYLPVGVGILLWLGLYLREPRLRALVPLRRDPP